jgi:hypothetical protein
MSYGASITISKVTFKLLVSQDLFKVGPVEEKCTKIIFKQRISNISNCASKAT